MSDVTVNRSVNFEAGVNPESYSRLTVALAKLDVIRNLILVVPIRLNMDVYIGDHRDSTTEISRRRTLSLTGTGNVNKGFTGAFKITEKLDSNTGSYNAVVSNPEGYFAVQSRNADTTSSTITCTPQQILTTHYGDRLLGTFITNANVAHDFIVKQALVL